MMDVRRNYLHIIMLIITKAADVLEEVNIVRPRTTQSLLNEDARCLYML